MGERGSRPTVSVPLLEGAVSVWTGEAVADADPELERTGDRSATEGDLAPLPLAPLPRALLLGALPLPFGLPLAGDCLPPVLLPLPLEGMKLCGVVDAAHGASR